MDKCFTCATRLHGTVEILLQYRLHGSVKFFATEMTSFLSRASNLGSRVLLRKMWQNLHALGVYVSPRESGTVPVKKVGITSDVAHFVVQNLHGFCGPRSIFVRTRSKRGLNPEQKLMFYQDNIDAEMNEVSKWRKLSLERFKKKIHVMFKSQMTVLPQRLSQYCVL